MQKHRRKTGRQRGLSCEALEARRLMAFDPTASEQELMQLANRFRSDPRGEFARLIASVSPRRAFDPKVTEALNFFNTNLAIVQAELAVLNPVPPVGWDESAQRMAQDYLPFLAAAKQGSHSLDGTIQQRFNRYGFDVSGGASVRENIFVAGTSPTQTHAAYVIDWGNGPNGLQSSSHRAAMINTNVKFAGMAFATVPYEPGVVGPLINVQEFIGLGVTPPMITGAVFQDSNASGWYEAGEGKGGVQIKFEGAAGTFTIQTMSAGGYNAKIPAGTYTAIASGGGLRFPITKTGVVLGSQNVWLNFVYDPAVVPPDAYESNNTLATATVLTGSDQVLGNGTIHASDIDYFRLPANTSGQLKVNLSFSHAAGNLNLRLLDSSGAVLSSSLTASDLESITFNIVAGRSYYVQIDSAGGVTGGPYTLTIDVPVAQAPIARADALSVSATSAANVIDVLINDSDPDGSLSGARLTIAGSPTGSAQVVTGGGPKIQYTPRTGFVGVDRFQYTITDAQGLVSSPAVVEVMVVNLATPRPFQNNGNHSDVNGDSSTSPIDALLVINQINRLPGGRLPTAAGELGSLFGFVDVSGNGTLEPMDALLVINQLNASGEGEIALESLQSFAPVVAKRAEFVDLALLDMGSSDSWWERRKGQTGRR